jgi:hypothetical protein
MAPDLLFHPIFDVAETLARVPHLEVIHPTSELPIDKVYYLFNRL